MDCMMVLKILLLLVSLVLLLFGRVDNIDNAAKCILF